ncbi:hypothetical protein CEXT_483581 [Caerostris extrusa]|uniref:Uncharacterized protein n=1 Tax=Caerostris extrusa TaxID=172846 RepID=A0AAV4VGU2_CAEEX|nr:hypothetical protein CEXT_483581 [Caerostris extrusa]
MNIKPTRYTKQNEYNCTAFTTTQRKNSNASEKKPLPCAIIHKVLISLLARLLIKDNSHSSNGNIDFMALFCGRETSAQGRQLPEAPFLLLRHITKNFVFVFFNLGETKAQVRLDK